MTASANPSVTGVTSISQRLKQWLVTLREWLHKCWKALCVAADAANAKARGTITRMRRRFQTTDPETTLYQVFEAESNMEGVVFLRPAQTAFLNVDLSNVLFRGTNLRGIYFVGVNWWQPQLRRNGLRDEVFFGLSADGPFRYAFLPALEETCRNARVALEDNRSFNVASDFYVGEMEALRRRLPFLRRHIASVPALYRIVSKYGTSVGQALLVLLCLIGIHTLITMLLAHSAPGTRITDSFLRAGYQTARLLAFQSLSTADAAYSVQGWLDVLFRVLFPIQLAMLALAFRSRIKRH
jgi:hypothetical protein